MALSRGLPSATESLPRGFSTWLPPWRSWLAAYPPAWFTPSREQPITRTSRAPQTWVERGPTPSVAGRRGSAEHVCEPSARSVLNRGVPAWQTPVVYGTERTRFTPVHRTRSVLVCERDALRLVNAVNSAASETPRADGAKRRRHQDFLSLKEDRGSSPLEIVILILDLQPISFYIGHLTFRGVERWTCRGVIEDLEVDRCQYQRRVFTGGFNGIH